MTVYRNKTVNWNTITGGIGFGVAMSVFLILVTSVVWLSIVLGGLIALGVMSDNPPIRYH